MIYPVPQKNNLNGSALKPLSVCVQGEYCDLAKSILDGYGIAVDGGFVVEICVCSTRKTTYIESLSRLSDEKYYIYVKENGAVIETSSRRGVFRAVNTLAKLIADDELKTGELEDYPLFETRGYIEGFYGPTWENDKRFSVMQLMAKYGMNTFFYAPKDDEYHRAKWRDLYPEAELLNLKNLFEFAKDNELDFNWCIGPGLTYHYSDSADFDALIRKIESIYSLGVRDFGLLLDDIPENFQYPDDEINFNDMVDAHISLVNRTHDALKNLDKSINLTVCPTQYTGLTDDYYITAFGRGVPSDVRIFWTGRDVCSGYLTCREADDFTLSTKHKPFYWDNYPVNDAEMFNEMHLGAVKGRDKELYRHSEGLIANVMEYAECSKIPLMTIADYLWNPAAYNSESSLENAHRELLGEKAGLFAYLAEHLCVSCVSRYGSKHMSEVFSYVNFLLATGKKQQALEEFDAYNQKLHLCLEMVSDKSVPLFAELGKWVDKFAMCCELMDALFAAWKSPTSEKIRELSVLIKKYNSDAVVLTGFCLREAVEKTLSGFENN